jgi:hypothetical protein
MVDAVLNRLRDPDSAKFKDLVASVSNDGEVFFCGRLNAKNSYGGYTGFETFVGNREGKNGPAGVTGFSSDPVTGAFALLGCKAIRMTNGLPVE